METKLTKEDYLEIYRMLEEVSPVPYDCGMICGAACCDPDRKGEDLGIYLLPGEEKVHDMSDPWLKWDKEKAKDYDFPDSWEGIVYFADCTCSPEDCNREKRPLQCRSFPLAPHINPEGKLVLIYDDSDVPYSCPLIESGSELSEDFMKATYLAWKKLTTDPLIRDLVMYDSAQRNPDAEYVYPK